MTPRRLNETRTASKSIGGLKVLPAILAMCLSGTSEAQEIMFDPSFRITGFLDNVVDGGSDSGSAGYARADAFLAIRNVWSGGTLNFHLEATGGDDITGLGASGVVWPTNVYAALPRLTGDGNATLSFTLTQELGPLTRLSLGKFNVVELARNTPLAGGKGRGGFQYTGIAAPPSFVFPPYVFGGQISHSTGPMSYSLFVYDPNNAQGEDFWGNMFEDGVVFNGSATYRTEIAGRTGFYGINLIHSTAEGTDYDSLLLPPDADDFARQTKGITFAALKFQQFLVRNPNNPDQGWGVFGQISFGDGNPHQLDSAYILGLAGTSPIAGRENDRWGVAWARYNWSDAFVAALEAGGGLNDEWAVEAFYEAEITDTLRIGGNIMHIRPGLPGFEDVAQVGLRLRASF